MHQNEGWLVRNGRVFNEPSINGACLLINGDSVSTAPVRFDPLGPGQRCTFTHSVPANKPVHPRGACDGCLPSIESLTHSEGLISGEHATGKRARRAQLQSSRHDYCFHGTPRPVIEIFECIGKL
jgi:hypothetical protein